MRTGSGSSTARIRWAVVTSAAALCAIAAVLLSIFGLAPVLEAVKIVLLLAFVLICLTLAIFALLVAASSLRPLRRRGFGDWL